jgi:hypothetical protein
VRRPFRQLAILIESVDHGQIKSTHMVDFHKLNLYLVTLFEDVSHVFDSVLGQFGNMAEAFLARQNLYKGTKVHYTLDGARVNLPDLRLFNHAKYGVARGISVLLILAVNGDFAFFVHIDLNVVFLAQALNVLARRSDDHSNFVLVYLCAHNLGRKGRNIGGGLGNRLFHDREYVQPASSCLVERLSKYFSGNARDLDIHLEASDTVAGTGHLEVHVTKMIFVAQDV